VSENQTAHSSSLAARILWFGKGGTNDDNKSLNSASEIAEKPKRAIIVEDEMFVALHLETILEDLGLEVCEIVATGRDALDAAIASPPDIIFMDINLRGDIDGVEAARLIREKSDTPIVFVTAYGDESTLKRVNAVAPNSPVLQKPPMISALIAAIKKAIGADE
jgi:CheY-like chemotaxis protein